LTGALANTKDEFSDYIQSFHQKRKQLTERAFKQCMEAITSFREIPDRSISSDIDRTYKVRRMDPAELYED
jgi:hypothetical protein